MFSQHGLSRLDKARQGKIPEKVCKSFNFTQYSMILNTQGWFVAETVNF